MKQTYKAQNLAISTGLFVFLGACQVPSSSYVSSGDGATLAGDRASIEQIEADESTARTQPQTPTPVTAEDAAAEIAAACPKEDDGEENDAAVAPLTTPENRPVFEQFNFRPQAIFADSNSVVVKTPYYSFARCDGATDWTISATEAPKEAALDYEQMLAQMADPKYETLTVNGQDYQYRVRLQAEWLREQLTPPTKPAEQAVPDSTDGLTTAGEAGVDAVFFELQGPEGDFISRELYTLEELQAAHLGASLGTPSIAGTAITGSPEEETIWFAATTSQGEGDSGFASLINFDVKTGQLTVQQPDEIQGDQITAIAATGSDQTGAASTDATSTEATSTDTDNTDAGETDAKTDGDAESNTTASRQPLTLWLGTQRSGEGNPYFPANGLVAYEPSTQKITPKTVTNSPLVGAIPHQLAVTGGTLWIGTGNGVCEVQWQTVNEAKSWNCWRFTATADLPEEGVDIYKSFLSTESSEKLTGDSVEVLWATEEMSEIPGEEAEAENIRYEVVYDKGFETELSQGGYRVANEVARRGVEGEPIFWPGRQWHWRGDRFTRTLDEVALNLVGGGPYGLVSSNSRNGFNFDHNAIRGDFDLLDLTRDTTKVRYYSAWVAEEDLAVYPAVVATQPPEKMESNPLTALAKKLTDPQGP